MDPNNFRHLSFSLTGPQESAYEGGIFEGELYLTEEYPSVPPRVMFRTEIFHPNIDMEGSVDLAKHGRLCSAFVHAVLCSLIDLLACPDEDNITTPEYLSLWNKDPDMAEEKAR